MLTLLVVLFYLLGDNLSESFNTEEKLAPLDFWPEHSPLDTSVTASCYGNQKLISRNGTDVWTTSEG